MSQPRRPHRQAARSAAPSDRPRLVPEAEAALAQLIATCLRRGYYGTAGIVISIQDGTIQHVRVATERLVK